MQGQTTLRENYSVIPSSLWRMAPSSCYLILDYVLFVVAVTVSSVRTVRESLRLFDSSGTGRSRTSHPKINSGVSWWNMHSKERTQACLFSILLQLVRGSLRTGWSVSSSYFSTIDKALADIPRSKIRHQLLEVGFDDARQSETVGGLSGGWKMKLELARAMLYNADLLLLDEVSKLLTFESRSTDWPPTQPTNHVCREIHTML